MTSRREFLKTAGAVATTAMLAPGVTLFVPGGDAEAAAAAAGKADPAVRWGLLIDATKCKEDCSVCVDACADAHGWNSRTLSETEPKWIRKVNVKHPTGGTSFNTPVMCQHCANPPCVDVCPTGASFKRVDGIVLVDRHICIGCRYCMMACPYKARSFVHEALEDQKPDVPRGKGTVESCNLCVKRVDAGLKPRCVEACKNHGGNAILFGNLNDPNSEISKRVAEHRATRIRADMGCEPGVYYTGIT